MHSTLRDMMKGLPGAEDVMGLDANLRQNQNSSMASHPEHSTPGPSLLVPAGAAVSAVDRHDSLHPGHDGSASEQDGDPQGDGAGDAFLATSE